jgi:hypothetical protein
MDAHLLQDIEAFLGRHQMAPTTFGAMVNDRHFVRQLRAGRRVWPETASRVRQAMADFENRKAAS